VSNFSIVKLKALLESSRVKPEVNQVELHPYLQQPALVDFCRKHKIYLTAYSPLGSPDRPARARAEGEPALMEDPTIKAIAGRHCMTPAQVLLSWIIAQGASVIPKSVNPRRLEQNLAAVDLTLSREDLLEISNLNRNRRYYTGGVWTIEGSPYTMENLWDE
jgi:alcohol dehydrogenase (NADP+)